MAANTKNIARIFIAIFSVFLTAGPNLAQEIPQALSNGLDWAQTRGSRRSQAQDWLKEIEKIDSQIPTLSPAEQEWLRVEVDEEEKRNGGGMTTRSMAARRSREGLIRSTKPKTQEMVGILKALSNSSPMSESAEVELWTALAYAGLDSNFWGDIANLGQKGVLERTKPNAWLNGIGDYQNAMSRYWSFRAMEIMGRVTLPYLQKMNRLPPGR